MIQSERLELFQVESRPFEERHSETESTISRCCKDIFKFIRETFSRCRRPQYSFAPIDDLQSNQSSKTVSSVSKFFSHKYTQVSLALGSVAATVTSAALLTPILKTFTNECVDELNDLSDQLSACESKYEASMILYKSIIGVSSGILGCFLQKKWELLTENGELGILPYGYRFLQKGKELVSYIQQTYSYEFHLAIAYLYGGLWINTDNADSWNAYYQCQAASIGILGGFLGMYSRIQWVAAKDLLNKPVDVLEEACFSRENCLKNVLLLTTCASVVGATSKYDSQIATIIREVGMMILGRSIGTLIARGLDWQSRFKKSYPAKTLSICFRSFLAPMVVAGYYVYLTSSDLSSRLSGAAILGFAEGIKDYFYEPYEFLRNNILEDASNRDIGYQSLTKKVCCFMFDYWKTIGLIGFAISSAQLGFLDCYDVQTFDCPISLALSNNYISISGAGINIVLITGLAQYYLRKSLRFGLSYLSNTLHQNRLRAYINLTDRYQFDLLSIIPYAIIKSGVYIEAYNDFATYNPPLPLILIGFTFGTYKERVNAQITNRNSFPDPSVLASLI